MIRKLIARGQATIQTLQESYTITQTIVSYVFTSDSNGVIPGAVSFTSNIIVSSGNTRFTDFTIGSITKPIGFSAITVNNTAKSITFSVAANTTNLADSGNIIIPVIIAGVTYNLSFSWSKSKKGQSGSNGADSYTIKSSRQGYIVSTDKDGRIHTTVTTSTIISALKGKANITPVIGTLPTVAGCSLSKNGTTVTIAFQAGTSLAENDIIDIPITVDSIPFTVSFSFAKARTGANGATGSAGVDANMLSWVRDWNNNKTTIGTNSVITPKLFAGVKNSNGTLTGIAIGHFPLSTSNASGAIITETINGLYGFRNGYKTFSIDNSGNVEIGRGNQLIRYNAVTARVEFGSEVTLNWVNAINTAKTEAINTAASTAQLKADAAKNAAITTAATDATNKVNYIEIGGDNHLWNGDFRFFSTNNSIGWDNILNGNYSISHWGSGYNAGVAAPTTGYHAHLNTVMFGYPVLELVNKNSIINQPRRWLGISSAVYQKEKLVTGAKYTFSADVMTDTTGAYIHGGVYSVKKGQTNSGFHSGSFRLEPSEANRWQRMSYTFTLDAQLDIEKAVSFYIYGYSGAEGICWIKNVSLQMGTKGTWVRCEGDVKKDIDDAKKAGTDAQAVADAITEKANTEGWTTKLTFIGPTGIFTGTLSANTVNTVRINASQITAGTIDAARINVSALKASLITAGNIEALTLNVTRGKIGGWIISTDTIYHNLNGKYIIIKSGEGDSPVGAGRGHRGLTIYNDDSQVGDGQVKLVQMGALANAGTANTWSTETNYGFRIALKGGKDVFRADNTGATIAGWKMDTDALYRGTKNNISGRFTAASGAITLGLNGIRGFKWRFESTGAGAVAGGNISWDATGKVTFSSSVTLNWTDAANTAANNALNSAKSYADTKKTEAINAAATDATNKVNAIKVGGRNLYKKSSSITRLVNTPTIQKEESADSSNGFKLTGQQNLSCGIRINRLITHNGSYVISFFGKSNGTSTPNFNMCDIACSGNAQFTTTWKKFELKVTVTNYSDATYHFLDIESLAWLYYWFKDFKVEEGTKPTDWSPAPEDTEAGIQEVLDKTETLVGALGGTSFPKLTKITSTGIYTGTIEANQIKANSITANQINAGSIQSAVVTAGAINALTCNFVRGTIGGFSITAEKLHDTGKHIVLQAGNSRRIGICKAANATVAGGVACVMMYYNNDTDWGLYGHDGTAPIFKLGAVNQVAGWNINATQIHKNNVYLGADGSVYNGTKWKLNNDGSGLIAAGAITWNAAGTITFSSAVTLNWTNAATNALNTAKSYADTKKTEAVNAAASDASTKANAAKELASAMAFGKMIYRDPEFRNGLNNINVYNNSNNGTVTITRTGLSSAPNDSKTVLEIRTNGAASPGNGGFNFGTATYNRKVYTIRIIAKIPTGRNIEFATNNIGTGGSHKWLTSNAGTGDWQEYIYKVVCGTSNFSSTNYFYITGTQGTSATPLVWYVAYATVFDTTASEKYTTTIDSNGIYTSTLNANQITAGTISADRIAAGSINGNKITASTITATQIASRTITADRIRASSITAGEIAAGTITTTQIASRTITADKIKASSITAGEIAAGTITATQIAARTITATKIATGTITANEINATSIRASVLTADAIAALTITTGKLHVTSGATIGGWNVDGNSLSITSAASAKILVEPSGTRFLRINDTTNELMAVRADGVTGIRIYTQSTTGTCLNMIAQSGGMSVESYGSHKFVQRQGETWNAPGVLRSARINGGGGTDQVWGNGTPSFYSSRQTTGFYRITHNLGHTEYTPMVSMISDWNFIFTPEIYPNYFMVKILTASGKQEDDNFNVMIIGRNRA